MVTPWLLFSCNFYDGKLRLDFDATGIRRGTSLRCRTEILAYGTAA
jgi:hypothetical protein